MGDFGPSFFRERERASGSIGVYVCDDCGTQLPHVTRANTPCPLCGGMVRQPALVANASTRGGFTTTAAMQNELEAYASLVPTTLFEELTIPSSNPADESAVAELPLVKLEPHVQITIASSPGKISRDLLAAAAERRRKASLTNDPADPSHDHASSHNGMAAAEPTEMAALQLEFRGTGSTFGKLLADIEGGVGGPLVLADPIDGASDFRVRLCEPSDCGRGSLAYAV